MDGTKRANLRRGMRVAIVLKCDQPTGKRTIGIVDAILTPSAEHHRGIKVRLSDGQVGRVQEILPPQQAPAKVQPHAAALVLLLVRSPDGLFYARRFRESPQHEYLCLGIDCDAGKKQPELAARELLQHVSDLPPDTACTELFRTTIEAEGTVLHLSCFSVTGSAVTDPEKGRWHWTGWASREELLVAEQEGRLSPESVLAVEALRARRAI